VTNNVVVILCGGSRYIGKNVSTKGHYYVTHFVENRKYTNVMIMSAPHRFDLSTALCMNEEVRVLIEKRITKMFNHIQVM
jgi:hypothetical protein